MMKNYTFIFVIVTIIVSAQQQTVTHSISPATFEETT
jgi:hypothetical protein